MVSLLAPLSDCGSLRGNDRSSPAFSALDGEAAPVGIVAFIGSRFRLPVSVFRFRSSVHCLLELRLAIPSQLRAGDSPAVHVQPVSVSCTSGPLHLRSPRESVDLPLGGGLFT